MVRIFCWDIALDMGLESSLSLYVYPCLMTLILCPGFPVFWGWSEWAASLFFVMVFGLCFCAFLSIWCFCSSAGMSVVAFAAVGWCWVPVTTCFLSGWGSLPASGPVVRWFVVTVHSHSGVFLLTLGGGGGGGGGGGSGFSVMVFGFLPSSLCSGVWGVSLPVVPLSSWLVCALFQVLLIQRRVLLTWRYLPGLSGGWICRFVPFYICPSGRTCMLPGLWSVWQVGHLGMMQWPVVPCLFLLPLWQCPLLSFGLLWHGWLGLRFWICGCRHRFLWC